MWKKYLSIPRDDSFAGDLDTWLPKDPIPGEKVLWVGRPRSAMALLRIWWPEALIGVGSTFMGLAAIVVSLSMVAAGAPELGQFTRSLIPGVLFLIVGIQTLSQALRSWRNASEVRYVLTDIRLVTRELDAYGGLTERDILPGTLREIRWRERRDGSGDLLFGTRPTMFNGHDQPVGIFAIENVRLVDSMVRSILMPEV